MTRGFAGRLALAAASLLGASLLGDQLLRAVLLDCPPAYWLPNHAPRARVIANVGSVSAEWTTNSLGFHDRDHERDKPPGARRLVCIGDSFLDGPTEETLPAALERRLAASVAGAEVINLSAPGIGPDLYLALLASIGLCDAPDAVRVFVYVGNDFRDMERFGTGAPPGGARLFARPPESSLIGSLLPRTALVLGSLSDRRLPTRWRPPDVAPRWLVTPPAEKPQRLARLLTHYVAAPHERILAHLRETLRDDELADACAQPTRLDVLALLVATGLDVPVQDRVALLRDAARDDAELAEARVAGVAALLVRMSELCRARAADFGVVLVPTMVGDPSVRDVYERLTRGRIPDLLGDPFSLARRLRERLERAGVAVADLAPAFAAQPGGYLRFDGHWNERGVATAADFLAADLAVKLTSRN